MSFLAHSQHFFDLLFFSHSFFLSFAIVKILDGFPSHRSLLRCFFSVVNSALKIKWPLHMNSFLIFYLFSPDLFIKFMIGMLETFLYTLYHLTIALPVLEIDRIAMFHLLDFFLFVGFFHLLVLLSGLSCWNEEHLLFLFVHLEDILAWSMIVEHFVPFVFSQNHLFFLFEFAQCRDDSEPCVG